MAMTNPTGGPPAGPHQPGGGGFIANFLVLRGAVRELWIVFGVKFLSIVAYALMNSTLVLWLSSDLGFDDARAGFMVGAWSTVMTLFTVLVGSFTDAIGLRRAFLLGLAVCLVSRSVMTFTTAPWLTLSAGMLLLAFGEALSVPVVVAATRRYSTTAQRSISFSLTYAIMNAGFLAANLVFDYIRQGLGEHGHFTLPVIGIQLTTYRTIFLVALGFQCTLLPLLYFGLRDGVEATDEGVRITPAEPKYAGQPFWNSLTGTLRDGARETVQIFGGLWRQAGFYRFLAFLALAAVVRLIFVHMYYTYPKFGIRELGPGAPVGHLFAINSILILFLAPVVGALTQKNSAYKMVTVGSAVAAGSVFIMAAPPAWFASLADGRLGHGIVNVWLGGYERFSPDDFQNLPTLAKELQAGQSSIPIPLSEVTRSLLHRKFSAPMAAASAPAHPGTALIELDDLTNPAGLISRLQNDAAPATHGISQFLWKRFSDRNRAKMADAAAPLNERQAALATELNSVLKGDTLFDASRFSGVALSDATRSVIGSGAPGQRTKLADESILLNRLLLEDAYPDLIERSDYPLRVALVADFGKAIHGEPLSQQSGFAAITLSPLTRERLAEHPTGRRLVYLNRLILEDAFPNELSRNRLGTPGSVNPYYVMIFLYIVLLSVGESIYSPRLYEYAAAVAPKGQEASYMSLSYLPFFLAKLLAASFSGVLVARYCPEIGPRNSGRLWLIIAVTTAVAPIGLMIFRRWIRVPEAGREG
jgi:MFS family permease